MTDYLNPSHIPYANSCVSCGAEMPEGDMVCKACSTTQESLQEEKVRKSAEIIREGIPEAVLKCWLIEQIEQETDITRLNTLKRMLND
jgi:predicted nucleic acid-binding Zn ribbon protein